MGSCVLWIYELFMFSNWFCKQGGYCMEEVLNWMICITKFITIRIISKRSTGIDLKKKRTCSMLCNKLWITCLVHSFLAKMTHFTNMLLWRNTKALPCQNIHINDIQHFQSFNLMRYKSSFFSECAVVSWF